MDKAVSNINLWRLFWSFFKIGSFTFGGGMAMIHLMQMEVVDKRGWVDKDEFFDLVALAQTAPGPIAVNTSVFIGYKVAGKRGAVITTLGSILPAFMIILLIALFFADIRTNPIVERVLKGMRPAVLALILVPIYTIARNMGFWRILIAITAALLVWLIGISPIYMIIAGALGGYIYGLYRKDEL